MPASYRLVRTCVGEALSFQGAARVAHPERQNAESAHCRITVARLAAICRCKVVKESGPRW